mgnify:CR=1 FL=1
MTWPPIGLLRDPPRQARDLRIIDLNSSFADVYRKKPGTKMNPAVSFRHNDKFYAEVYAVTLYQADGYLILTHATTAAVFPRGLRRCSTRCQGLESGPTSAPEPLRIT